MSGELPGKLGKLPGNLWIAVGFHSERSFGEVAWELPGKFGELPGKSGDFPEARGSRTPSERLAKFFSKVPLFPSQRLNIKIAGSWEGSIVWACVKEASCVSMVHTPESCRASPCTGAASWTNSAETRGSVAMLQQWMALHDVLPCKKYLRKQFVRNTIFGDIATILCNQFLKRIPRESFSRE